MSTGHRPDPDERVVELRVDTLNVVDSQRLVEHLLVERQREPAVYELTMIQRLYSHTHTHTHTNHHHHHHHQQQQPYHMSTRYIV